MDILFSFIFIAFTAILVLLAFILIIAFAIKIARTKQFWATLVLILLNS